MLKVTVEILPHGYDDEREVIGEMTIINDGTGNRLMGSYDIEANEAGKETHGRITNYFRAQSLWKLLGEAMEEVEYNEMP